MGSHGPPAATVGAASACVEGRVLPADSAHVAGSSILLLFCCSLVRAFAPAPSRRSCTRSPQATPPLSPSSPSSPFHASRSLHDNTFTGEVPPQWAGMAALQTLSLPATLLMVADGEGGEGSSGGTSGNTGSLGRQQALGMSPHHLLQHVLQSGTLRCVELLFPSRALRFPLSP